MTGLKSKIKLLKMKNLGLLWVHNKRSIKRDQEGIMYLTQIMNRNIHKIVFKNEINIQYAPQSLEEKSQEILGLMKIYSLEISNEGEKEQIINENRPMSLNDTNSLINKMKKKMIKIN